MSFEWDASSLFSHLDIKEKATQQVVEQRVGDATDDLARISSNIAPIKSGNLRQQVDKSVNAKTGSIVGEVTFSAVENSSGYGRFNYALWTHEFMDSLGELSQASPGTDGYEVGSKYVTRPLEGERERWLKEWATGVKGVLD
jgi:hypothetical protein